MFSFLKQVQKTINEKRRFNILNRELI
uniref:Uncharacterized protein n=1 Tax=Anguilla anguilla TaxID=7936 RepID=A0A0E9Q4F2_ANGAN